MLPTRFERSTINLAHFDRRNELISPLDQIFGFSRYSKLICGYIRNGTPKCVPQVLSNLIKNIGELARYDFRETTNGLVNCNQAYHEFHEYLSDQKQAPINIEPFRATIFVHTVQYQSEFILNLTEKMEKRIKNKKSTFDGYSFDMENDLYYFQKGIEFPTGSEMNDISAIFKIAPVQAYCTKSRSLVFMFVFVFFFKF